MLKIDGEEFPDVIKVNSADLNKAVARMRPINNEVMDLMKISNPNGRMKNLIIEYRWKWKEVFKILLDAYFEKTQARKEDVIIVLILRAANVGALPAFMEMLFSYGTPVCHVWTIRDEKTKIASALSVNLPAKIPVGKKLLFLDPVIASATSSILALSFAQKCNWESGKPSITLMSGIAAPQGLASIEKAIAEGNIPPVKIITGFTGPKPYRIKLSNDKYVAYADGEFEDQEVAGDAGNILTGITSPQGILLM